MIDVFSNAKLQKVHLEKNGGKSRALLEGITRSRGTHIVMIDADLLHLRAEHITALIAPVREGVVDVTLSIRENSLPIYKLLGTDFVSGERVLPKSLFDDQEYFRS